MSDPIIIDTPDGIEHFQMARTIAMLKLEVRTGMKCSRGSVLAYVKQQYGVKARTKAAALDEMCKLYKTRYGWEYGQTPNKEGN